jgi:hypothetical protein
LALHPRRRRRSCAPTPWPEPLLHLELRRLREVRLHEHDFKLHNGGHADSKDRVGEKHGVRGAGGLIPNATRMATARWRVGNFPADCDERISRLLATAAACLLGCPKRAQHSLPAVSTVPRRVVTVAWASSYSFWRYYQTGINLGLPGTGSLFLIQWA